jgi:hypothetical protein
LTSNSSAHAVQPTVTSSRTPGRDPLAADGERVPENAAEDAHNPEWQARLTRIAWAMHDHFLVLPGYATHLSRPHHHNVHSPSRLRSAVITAFTDAGVEADLAEQSWYIFVVWIISWLAVLENPLELGPNDPRFELFLHVLVRGPLARRQTTVGWPAGAERTPSAAGTVTGC